MHKYGVDTVYHISDTTNMEAQMKAAAKDFSLGKKVAVTYPDGSVEVLR